MVLGLLRLAFGFHLYFDHGLAGSNGKNHRLRFLTLRLTHHDMKFGLWFGSQYTTTECWLNAVKVILSLICDTVRCLIPVTSWHEKRDC